MVKKMLFIVDPQNDFINGSLAVEGAEGSMIDLARHIERHADEYELVGISFDYHPVDHCSFKENKGIWPSHCVQHTVGSALYPLLFDALKEAKNGFYLPFTKGERQGVEEYSFMDKESNVEFLKTMLEEHDITEIDFCGIALNYCVSSSIKGVLEKVPNVKINLLTKFSPAIGDPQPTLDELVALGVNVI